MKIVFVGIGIILCQFFCVIHASYIYGRVFCNKRTDDYCDFLPAGHAGANITVWEVNMGRIQWDKVGDILLSGELWKIYTDDPDIVDQILALNEKGNTSNEHGHFMIQLVENVEEKSILPWPISFDIEVWTFLQHFQPIES